jgi:hypothetical protein
MSAASYHDDMTDKQDKWTIRGVSAETRKAVAVYAALYDLTVAEVLEQELAGLRGRTQLLRDGQREVAAAVTGVQDWRK